jgi:hypothetical protein
MRNLLLCGALVVLAALAVGCSDDDDSSSEGEGGAEFDVSQPTEQVECRSAADCIASKPALSNDCERYICVDGACGTAPKPADTPCEGSASGACQQNACDGAGDCAVRAAFDFTPCGDTNGCVADVCIDGDCQQDFAIITCDDQSPCTSDSCVLGVCRFEPTDGACDDGDPCTTDDVCVEGACRGTPGPCPCEEDDECSSDGNVCNGQERCIDGACQSDPSTAIDCADGALPCQVGTCNPANGACQYVSLPNGTACDDGDACTTNDLCTDSECAGEPDDEAPECD